MEKLQKVLNMIKEHEEYNKYKYNGKFPNITEARKNPKKYLPIIVEQGEKIIKKENHINHKDQEVLSDTFLNEIDLFLTENQIQIERYNPRWGQQLIASNALYHIARSKVLKHSYEHIDLLMNPKAYDSFSIPFIIRLAIEKKLKSMIGFVSCDVTNSRNRSQPS